MTPWRRRLNDYRQLIRQAEATYFEPNLFRLNLNNAIQTSRTVTFLIQKEKDSIPNFENWYNSNVLDVIKGDRVMDWLKDARNIVEKRGELETLSECFLELLFSYTDRGPVISAKREGLMNVGIKRLMRFGQKRFPTGVYRDSAVIVDRRWVVSSLPDWEVTDALHYGHSKLARIVDKLDSLVGNAEHQVSESRLAVGSAARRAYIKTNDGRTYILGATPRFNVRHDIDAVKERYGEGELRRAFSSRTFQDLFENFVELACHVFNKDGEHLTICISFNDSCHVTGTWPVHFADHTDKLIFWNHLAHVAAIDQSIWGLIFISEFWNRAVDGFPEKRISELKVLGEGLQIVGVSKANDFLIESIPISREGESATVSRDRHSVGEKNVFPNFLVPLRNAWGLPPWSGVGRG